jgi:hypothetical protein
MMATAIFVFLESLDEFTGTYFVGVPDVATLPLMTGKLPFLNLQEPVGCCRRPIGLISDDARRCLFGAELEVRIQLPPAESLRTIRPCQRSRRLGQRPVRRVIEHRQSIGRNDSCPCSSGKKFKKCCLGTVRFESLGP